jgi:hypothetical protein
MASRIPTTLATVNNVQALKTRKNTTDVVYLVTINRVFYWGIARLLIINNSNIVMTAVLTMIFGCTSGI